MAFFADGKLKKIATKGGVPTTLSEAPSTRGGSWGDDGNIIFAPSNRSALLRVSAAGGTTQPVTELRGEWTGRSSPLLLACGLRRGEVAALGFDDIQRREDHWAIVDLTGKGGACSGLGQPDNR